MLANPIDIHIGQKIREFRTTLKMSQDQVGELVGITLQQVQKYETGINRISASRLYELAQIFEKPVSSFFSEYVRDEDYHNFDFKPDEKRFQMEGGKKRGAIKAKYSF
jgi:transcriptional regulator with XRE-family HTH domain